MDNTALARFITSLGSLNGYGSTLYQTKKALDEGSTKPLRQDVDDIAIFQDAIKGIEAIKKNGFSTDGIIAINTQFDSPSEEQPNWPGHLRNAKYNEDDRTVIIVDTASNQGYFPHEVITRADIDAIVEEYDRSKKTETDAWRVFARLSKLQPFQDGNKRTALIAANAAHGSFDTEDYLLLPLNDLDRAEFTIKLMRYYESVEPAIEEKYFQEMLDLLPSPGERKLKLHEPIENNDLSNGGYKIKTEIRSDKKN